MLQAGGKLVDVGGCDVAAHALLQKRYAVAADGIAADLQKQSVHRVGVEFLRSEAHDFVQSSAQGKAFAVRPVAGHGIEGIG